jgi:hypothetical protein
MGAKRRRETGRAACRGAHRRRRWAGLRRSSPRRVPRRASSPALRWIAPLLTAPRAAARIVAGATLVR